MKRIAILLGMLLLALSFGAGQAAAEDDPGSAGQTAGQSASSGQSAGGYGGAYQAGPTNSASSIRVLSPGNDGAVSQSNSTTAGAVAANGNSTNQSTNQSQAGGMPGSDATQIAGQAAKNDQDADANATAVQLAPSNGSQSIRVLSPGNNGNLTQSNSATAGAAALNGNETDQDVDQTQSGSGYGSDATQIAGQEASNDQDADADATAFQVKPSNDNQSIRVLSPGNDGDVSQSNSTTAIAAGLNGNKTDQSIEQDQGGALAPVREIEKPGYDQKDGHGSNSTQIAGQEASNKQDADATATAVQVKPSNSNQSIRVLSPGSNGDVTQSNSATAVGIAANLNKTDQTIDQAQGGAAAPAKEAEKPGYEKKDGHGSEYAQIAGQKASNHQDADATATAVQLKPSNTNQSIRVLSPGNDGDVTQSNSATAVGIAANLNATHQTIDQDQSGRGQGSGYTQIAGQEAASHQKADADAFALQWKPSNTNRSIRVLSPGHDGDVSQSNSTTAIAAGLNANKTDQSIDQDQTGRGHGGSYLQVAGQGAWNRQHADAKAAAAQLGASNENDPIRVGSPDKGDRHGKGDRHSKGGGSVEQSNSVGALALALNLNETCQALLQEQAGYGSDSLQVGGQGSWSDQRGGAMSSAIQGGKNKKKR
jgi:hypothetical protein